MKQKYDIFDVNNRIMQIMREKNLNKNSLSKLLDLSQPALTKIEKNLNLPSFKLLFEIIQNFPDVNPEWLLTGDGKMLRKNPVNLESDDQQTLIELCELQRKEITELKDELKEKNKQLGDSIRSNLMLLEREKEETGTHRNRNTKCDSAG